MEKNFPQKNEIEKNTNFENNFKILIESVGDKDSFILGIKVKYIF